MDSKLDEMVAFVNDQVTLRNRTGDCHLKFLILDRQDQLHFPLARIESPRPSPWFSSKTSLIRSLVMSLSLLIDP